MMEATCACQEAVRRYRTPDQTYENFRKHAAGWVLWLDDVSIALSNYLRREG